MLESVPAVLIYMPGTWEILILVLVVVVVFGASRVPQLMKGVGQGIRQFKEEVKDGSDKEQDKEIEEKKK